MAASTSPCVPGLARGMTPYQDHVRHDIRSGSRAIELRVEHGCSLGETRGVRDAPSAWRDTLACGRTGREAPMSCKRNASPDQTVNNPDRTESLLADGLMTVPQACAF